MWQYNYSNELYHFGVKGMKWGVRRFQKKNGSLTPAGKKRYDNWSDDAKEASRIKSKGVKSMSNAELKKLNERTRLEQEYSRLNPGKIKKAMTFVTATAATVGTVVTLYNNSENIIKIGKKACDKITDVAGNMIMKDLAKGFAK